MIENTLERIAVALETIAKRMSERQEMNAPKTQYEAPAPVAQAAPVAAPLPFMGIPVATAPVAAAPQAPFTDQKGLVDYVMKVYQLVGPDKGNRIQSILAGMGCKNITDIKVEQYNDLFAQVESLKG